MLKEVLTRRLSHDEWPMPRVIAVDGSTAQINAATKVLEEHGIQIPVIGVVKDEKHIDTAIIINISQNINTIAWKKIFGTTPPSNLTLRTTISIINIILMKIMTAKPKNFPNTNLYLCIGFEIIE